MRLWIPSYFKNCFWLENSLIISKTPRCSEWWFELAKLKTVRFNLSWLWRLKVDDLYWLYLYRPFILSKCEKHNLFPASIMLGRCPAGRDAFIVVWRIQNLGKKNWTSGFWLCIWKAKEEDLSMLHFRAAGMTNFGRLWNKIRNIPGNFEGEVNFWEQKVEKIPGNSFCTLSLKHASRKMSHKWWLFVGTFGFQKVFHKIFKRFHGTSKSRETPKFWKQQKQQTTLSYLSFVIKERTSLVVEISTEKMVVTNRLSE